MLPLPRNPSALSSRPVLSSFPSVSLLATSSSSPFPWGFLRPRVLRIHFALRWAQIVFQEWYVSDYKKVQRSRDYERAVANSSLTSFNFVPFALRPFSAVLTKYPLRRHRSPASRRAPLLFPPFVSRFYVDQPFLVICIPGIFLCGSGDRVYFVRADLHAEMCFGSFSFETFEIKSLPGRGTIFVLLPSRG